MALLGEYMCVQHDLNVDQCGQIYMGDFLSVGNTVIE